MSCDFVILLVFHFVDIIHFVEETTGAEVESEREAVENFAM